MSEGTISQGSRKTVDLGAGPVARTVLRVAIPSVVGLSINAMHHLVNMAFVGMLTTEAVSAITTVIPVILLLAAIGEGVGVGVASYLARQIGAGRLDLAANAASTAILLTIPLSMAVAGLLLFDLDGLLRFFGTTEAALPLAGPFARILILGAPLLFLQMLFDFIAIAEGNTKVCMWILVGSFGINTVLDPIFIFGLHLGVDGAAWATVISEGAAVAVYVIYAARRRGTIHLHPRHFQMKGAMLRQIASVGVPATLATGLGAVASMLLYRIASGYGDTAVAGIGIAFRLLSGGGMPVIGFCLGAQAVLGHGWGANNYRRLLGAVRAMLLMTSAFSLAYAVVMIVFAPAIVGWFTDDPAVARIGISACRAFHVVFSLFGLQMVTVVALQSAGKARLAALLMLAPQGYLLIPALLILPPVWGVDGLIASQVLAAGLSAALALAIIVRQTNMLKKQLHCGAESMA